VGRSGTRGSNWHRANSSRPRPQLPGHGVVAPYTGGETLFGAELTRPAVLQRYEDGARIAVRPGRDPAPAGSEVLFVIQADGQLVPVTEHTRPAHRDEDTTVLLEPQQTTAGAAPALRQVEAGQPEASR
jgi:hypothetical protein